MQRFANRVGDTDIHPFEVIDYFSDDCLLIREMSADRDPNWKPIKVMDVCENNNDQYDTEREPPVWAIMPNPDAPAFKIKMNTKGQWRDPYGNSYRIESRPVKYHNFNTRR